MYVMEKVKRQVGSDLGPQGAIWVMLFSSSDQSRADRGLSGCLEPCKGAIAQMKHRGANGSDNTIKRAPSWRQVVKRWPNPPLGARSLGSVKKHLVKCDFSAGLETAQVCESCRLSTWIGMMHFNSFSYSHPLISRCIGTFTVRWLPNVEEGECRVAASWGEKRKKSWCQQCVSRWVYLRWRVCMFLLSHSNLLTAALGDTFITKVCTLRNTYTSSWEIHLLSFTCKITKKLAPKSSACLNLQAIIKTTNSILLLKGGKYQLPNNSTLWDY